MTATATPKIKDSEGKTYSADVLDMLVKIYRFMVLRMWEFTVAKAYAADHYTSRCNSASMSVAEKFIKELEYVKQLAEHQPITFYTIKHYETEFRRTTRTVIDIYGEREQEFNEPFDVLSDKEETLEIRTFDKRKMKDFINETIDRSKNPHCTHRYKKFEIIKTEKFNHEYLVEPK